MTMRSLIHNKLVQLRSLFWSPFAKGTLCNRPNAVSQNILRSQYEAMANARLPLPKLRNVGWKGYSQCDEDGILWFIFSLIGETNRKCIEICAGDGIECNSANLIINHGWEGLLIDGNKAQVARGRSFYANHPNTYCWPPKIVHEWITRDNVNQVISENGFAGPIDLLTIDLDGMDYWIWKAIDAISPQVVVVEYNDICGPERCITVPYSDSFDAYIYPTWENLPNFCGASLMAFVKLAQEKGYRFVGVNRYGFNAFFVRLESMKNDIPECLIKECFIHPKTEWGMRMRWPSVQDLGWIEV